jgi:hypothetical protein
MFHTFVIRWIKHKKRGWLAKESVSFKFECFLKTVVGFKSSQSYIPVFLVSKNTTVLIMINLITI